jgi:hypothetical protein
MGTRCSHNMKPVIHPEHIVKSSYPDVKSIPDTDIYSFLFERRETGNYPPASSPSQIAFIDAPSGYKLSFSQLKEKVDLFARSLRHQLDVREHDVVSFYSGNHVL